MHNDQPLEIFNDIHTGLYSDFAYHMLCYEYTMLQIKSAKFDCCYVTRQGDGEVIITVDNAKFKSYQRLHNHRGWTADDHSNLLRIIGIHLKNMYDLYIKQIAKDNLSTKVVNALCDDRMSPTILEFSYFANQHNVIIDLDPNDEYVRFSAVASDVQWLCDYLKNDNSYRRYPVGTKDKVIGKPADIVTSEITSALIEELKRLKIECDNDITMLQKMRDDEIETTVAAIQAKYNEMIKNRQCQYVIDKDTASRLKTIA